MTIFLQCSSESLPRYHGYRPSQSLLVVTQDEDIRLTQGGERFHHSPLDDPVLLASQDEITGKNEVVAIEP